MFRVFSSFYDHVSFFEAYRVIKKVCEYSFNLHVSITQGISQENVSADYGLSIK